MSTKVGDVFAELRLRSGKAKAGLKEFSKGLKTASGQLDKSEKKTLKLGRALKKVGAQAKKAGQGISKGIGIGTLAITGITVAAFAFAKAWAGTVDDIGKASVKLRIPAQELQALEHAADLSGASTQSLRKGIQNLNKFITEGREKGVTPFTKALFQVGLSLDDLKGKTKTQQFGIIGDALNALGEDARVSTLQMKLFGEEAGPQLANLTSAGTKGIVLLTDRTKDLGAVLTDEAFAAAANLNDELADTKLVMAGVANFINTRLAPLFTRIVSRVKKWVLANKELIATKLEKFLTVAASAAERLLPKIVDLAEGVFKFVESMGGIEGALKTAGLAVLAFKLVFIGAFGPLGPIVGGLIAVLALIDQIGSKSARAKAEIDKFASEDTLSEAEKAGLPKREVLEKTREGRSLLFFQGQKRTVEKEQREAKASLKRLNKEQEQKLIKASKSPTGAGFSTATARIARDRTRFDEQIRSSQSQIDELNRVINKKAAEFERSESDRKVQATTAKDTARENKLIEFRKLARLAINKKATPAQLKTLSALEKDLKIKRPEATPSFFAPSPTGEKAEEKTPQQLIQEALGGGGRLNVGGLVPSGPGTTINHNNFSINLASPDIDIIVKGLPRNANAMDVAQRVKEELQNAVQDSVRISYQTQVQQVVG